MCVCVCVLFVSHGSTCRSSESQAWGVPCSPEESKGVASTSPKLKTPSPVSAAKDKSTARLYLGWWSVVVGGGMQGT